jgi:hypothetical protein
LEEVSAPEVHMAMLNAMTLQFVFILLHCILQVLLFSKHALLKNAKQLIVFS